MFDVCVLKSYAESGCKPKKLPARVCMALCFPCAVTARHCCLRAPRSSRKPAFGHFLLTLSSSSVTCASQNGCLRPKVADHRGWSPIVCRTETIHTSGRLRGGRRKATKGNGSACKVADRGRRSLRSSGTRNARYPAIACGQSSSTSLGGTTRSRMRLSIRSSNHFRFNSGGPRQTCL